LKSYDDEIFRVQEIETRAEFLEIKSRGGRAGDQAVEETLSFYSFNVGIKIEGLTDITTEDIINKSVKLDTIIDNNIKKYVLDTNEPDMDMVNSLSVISRLTIGERYLVSEPMCDPRFCLAINKEIRESQLDKRPLNENVKEFLDIRNIGKSSLDRMNLSEDKELARGASGIERHKNLMEEKIEGIETLNDLVQKYVGRKKIGLIIEFTGGNYPFTSSLGIATKFADDGEGNKVIFMVKTKKGINGKVLSSNPEDEFTVLADSLKARIKSITLIDSRYVVILEEVGSTEVAHFKV
jgi:hypothetical protein